MIFNVKCNPDRFFLTDCGVRPIRQGRSKEDQEEGSNREARIVGGRETEFGDWPWQVLVRESTLLGLFTKNKCGGVLISNRHVLTAAHCQPGFLASLSVELGEHDITGNSEYMATMQRKVKRVVVHKDYKAPTFENDIAILELEKEIVRMPHIGNVQLSFNSLDGVIRCSQLFVYISISVISCLFTFQLGLSAVCLLLSFHKIRHLASIIGLI